jgi:hypothetical protein
MRVHFALGILLVLAACGREALVRSDLAGDWVLDEASRYRLPQDPRSIEPHLDLKGDGTMTATSLPGGMVYLGSRLSPTVISGSGTWELQSIGRIQRVLLRFRELEGIGAVESSTTLDCSGTTGLSRLFWWAGDPDAGGRVDFIQR